MIHGRRTGLRTVAIDAPVPRRMLGDVFFDPAGECPAGACCAADIPGAVLLALRVRRASAGGRRWSRR